MAVNDKSVCVSCKAIRKIENEKTEKILICSGHCGNFVHHQCSVFKPSEVKFLEANTNNIKWYCDTCGINKNVNIVNEVHGKLSDFERKIEMLFNIIKEQSSKLENQTLIINNLQKSQQSITNKQGPNTRSKTTEIEDSDYIKTYSKVISSTQHKKQGQDTNKNTPEPKQTTKKIPVEKNEKNGNIPEEKQSTQNNINNVNTNSVNMNKRTIRGSRTNTAISAAENRKWIFVSQLINTTKVEDVTKYLTENNIKALECEKLDIRNTNIAAFKIAVEEGVYEQMFDSDLWPRNTIVRPFRKNFWKMSPAILNK